jgi:undecaprenyl-diphosphatase
MTLFHAFLLGIVQGLTEFIPVSSTAHLLISQELLGLSPGSQLFAFSVIIQLGTVLAMVMFFWKDIWNIATAFILGIYHRRPFENLNARLGWLVIIATIPAAIAGLLLKGIVQARFEDPFTQAGIRLLVTAVLLFLVEYFDNRKRHLDSATWLDAVMVGLFQVLAVFPGASRSGTTIAGGMVRGFDRSSAARFAFLMSGPILVAAGLNQIIDVIELPGTTEFLPVLAVGFVVSAMVGWLSIKWLITFLSKHSLYIFVVYCAVVGSLLFILR